MGCAMLYVGLYVRIKPPVKGADIPGAGYMALVCIYLFAGFFQWGWGPVSNLMLLPSSLSKHAKLLRYHGSTFLRSLLQDCVVSMLLWELRLNG